MARDRLAAMRAQQGGNVSNNSYPTQASGGGGGYGGSGYGGGGGGGNGGYQSRRQNPYAQQDDRAYEMSDVQSSAQQSYGAPMNGTGGGDAMSSFYTEISSIQDSIRNFNDNIQRIGDLHSRSLNNTDDNAAQRNAAALDDIVEETSALSSTLKRRIKALEKQGGAGRDGQIRKQQTALVKSKFVEAIQAYQTVEQQYRTKYKQRMERQFKIVKPDATPEEVRAVVNDDSGGQIFSQALMNSNRYGESRAAYREVQERHEDIKRIERTLGELAQLFNDMSVLVEQQEDTINVIETQAAAVEKDTEAALQYTEKAVDSARGARRKRWICFIICLIVLIIPYDTLSQTPEQWQGVPLAPPDSIFQLTAAYKEDKFDKKVNLGVGAYRDDNNKPWVLPVVKEATRILLNDESLDHEYLPITGLPEFTTAAAKLILGPDSPALADGRVSSVQTISGTGANHLGALFLSRFYQWSTEEKQVLLSNPTWANHQAIFKNVGIAPVDYPYYDPKTIGLDFEGFVGSLKNAPDRSVFLIHGCAHNPTGVDPTKEQWTVIADVMLAKKHFAFLDCAYQGFASGSLDNDAWAVRHFVEKGVALLICQSFAKNAGLYGERVGALHVVSPSKEAAGRVKSQLSVLQRSEISNPPSHGARIVSLILNDAKLFAMWKSDIETMAGRIIDMRKELFRLLTEELHTPGNWEHIVKQIGMFSFTGISPGQSKALIEDAHIYLTGNGRISMAGLNTHNIRYFAESLDRVVRT
ncbi:Aspartate aminotransferase [Mycena kentingensis (nom. inval.)]|nr:Aspartate aminotransferase [Mycena kentingensis (nom. inval.)]